MTRSLAEKLLVLGFLATAGCGGEPLPGQPGGTVTYDTPEVKKAQEDAAKITPEQMMEQMKSGKNPVKK